MDGDEEIVIINDILNLDDILPDDKDDENAFCSAKGKLLVYVFTLSLREDTVETVVFLLLFFKIFF